MKKTVLYTLCFVLFVSGIASFLLDCEAPSQCSCVGVAIQCDNRRLPRIPAFSMTTHQSMVYLHLYQNRILVVPEDSFRGINADKLYIDLSENNMRDIHPMAFESVQDNVTILILKNNLLTTLPEAVANLSKLVYLDIHDNPIQTFDSHAMTHLGEHLEVFYVGSSALRTWPTAFGLLRRLNAFHLIDAAMTDLPANAFKGFATTLVNFEINNCNFTRVPYAVCDLRRIQNFNLINNGNFDTGDIFPACNNPLSSVTAVTINNNQLTSFPDVFPLFPSVTTLSVSTNPQLNSMDNLTVPDNNVLTSLILTGNNFMEVPIPIGSLTQLKTVDLRLNNITELYSHEMDRLTHLTHLTLSNNPLAIIEDRVFPRHSSLYQLSLDNTKLTTIPRAILNLEDLHTLDFRNNDLNCSCAKIGWLKNWAQIHILRINGVCGNPHFGEPILTFILLELPNC